MWFNNLLRKPINCLGGVRANNLKTEHAVTREKSVQNEKDVSIIFTNVKELTAAGHLQVESVGKKINSMLWKLAGGVAIAVALLYIKDFIK